MAVALGAYLYPGKCAYDTSWQPANQHARCCRAEPRWRLQQAHLKLSDCHIESCRGEEMIPRASSRPNLSMYCPVLYPAKSMEMGMPQVPQCHILRIVECYERLQRLAVPSLPSRCRPSFDPGSTVRMPHPGPVQPRRDKPTPHPLSSNFPRHSVLPLVDPPTL